MSIAEEHHDLTDDLAGGDPDYTEAPEAYGDVEGVNRALRRLARHHRERDAVVAVHQAELDRIQQRLDARLEIVDKAIAWESEGLAMYHRAVLRDDPSRKTVHLPCGTLKARAQQPQFVYDDDAVLAWAKAEAPDLVASKVVESVPKPELKRLLVVPALEEGETAAAVTSDGEVVPGVTVTMRGPSFTIDLGEDN